MLTTITSKGQVTVPKHIRDAMRLEPGCSVEFSVDRNGNVVLRKADEDEGRTRSDRFDAVRGKADVKWRTDALMALLRGDE